MFSKSPCLIIKGVSKYNGRGFGANGADGSGKRMLTAPKDSGLGF